MMKKIRLIRPILLLPILTVALIVSCKEESPVLSNPVEVINMITVTLSPVGGGEPAFWSYSDPDGPGGDGPEVIWEPLKPFTIYIGEIRLFDASVTPPVEITEEIKAEADVHQFFYDFRDVASSFKYLDFDDNGYPLGFEIEFIAYEYGEGLLNINLVHLAEKDIPGVSDGDITNAGGYTDLDMNFLVRIKE